jgi:uncharacterized membrane protein YqaE (UPF0057 family)
MKLKSGIIGLITLAILASCSTSNDVVSGRGIQKRKYNDGYYISLGKKFNKTNKDVKVEEVVLSEETAENFNAETIAEVENSTAPSSAIETSSNTEVIAPATNNDATPVTQVSEIETEENLITTQTEITEEKNESFKPGRIYAPKMIPTTVSHNAAGASGAMLILLVILCFFLPPLAVFLFEGASSRFWIDLVLFIIGIAVVGWLLSGLAGLALLVSVIFALLIVLSLI